MTTSTTRALSLHDVIAHGVGGPDLLDDHLAASLRASGRVTNLLPTTRRSIDGRLHEVINAGLNRDVVGVLAAGWQASAELRAAARRTLSTPGSTEFVPFLTLAIAQSIRPSVRLFVERDPVVTVELDIVVRARFQEVTAAVRAGALVAIDFGQCTITVSICTATGTLLVERTLTLTSNQRLDLPHPIELAQAHEVPDSGRHLRT
jgi:hypothetical protein